jgi:hypothetical protein
MVYMEWGMVYGESGKNHHMNYQNNWNNV